MQETKVVNEMYFWIGYITLIKSDEEAVLTARLIFLRRDMMMCLVRSAKIGSLRARRPARRLSSRTMVAHVRGTLDGGQKQV